MTGLNRLAGQTLVTRGLGVARGPPVEWTCFTFCNSIVVSDNRFETMAAILLGASHREAFTQWKRLAALSPLKECQLKSKSVCSARCVLFFLLLGVCFTTCVTCNCTVGKNAQISRIMWGARHKGSALRSHLCCSEGVNKPGWAVKKLLLAELTVDKCTCTQIHKIKQIRKKGEQCSCRGCAGHRI